MIKVIFLFCLFSFTASAQQFIMCSKGKVKVGDSLEIFEKKCEKDGKKGNYQASMLNFKTFEVIRKIYPDGTILRFIFMEKKLLFILD